MLKPLDAPSVSLTLMGDEVGVVMSGGAAAAIAANAINIINIPKYFMHLFILSLPP